MSSKSRLRSNPLFSDRADRALEDLCPYKDTDGNRAFPRRQNWDDNSLRIRKNVDLHSWFQNIIGDGDAGALRIEQCSIEDNFAFFGRIKWDKDGIYFCRLQGLIVEGCDLTEYYNSDPKDRILVSYYRLDFDIKTPGNLFKESLPHIHSVTDGSPRFPFMCTVDEYLPISFLEFIYLNHFHDEWLKWAKEVSKSNPGIEFKNIVDGFAEGWITIRLDNYRSQISQLKQMLSLAKKNRIYPIPPFHTNIMDLNYSTMIKTC